MKPLKSMPNQRVISVKQRLILWGCLASYSIGFWAVGEYFGWWDKHKVKPDSIEHILMLEHYERRKNSSAELFSTSLSPGALRARDSALMDTSIGALETDISKAKDILNKSPVIKDPVLISETAVLTKSPAK